MAILCRNAAVSGAVRQKSNRPMIVQGIEDLDWIDLDLVPVRAGVSIYRSGFEATLHEEEEGVGQAAEAGGDA